MMKFFFTIVKGLYYPECPYEFSILPVEILGNIYEKFLGKTIQFKNVKGGHTVIIEEKPEVKKAGGVFYTPQYIVNYIVENTIGVKIKGKTPNTIASLKVVDPAWGSGSFLVVAYQYLLDYHLKFYSESKQLKKFLNKTIYQIAENSYKLTIEEKQRILLNNIYGVDIDEHAVEVSKLSLYLKLLENEGKEAEGQLFKFSDLKLLPSLSENIKCGNSLVGQDYYADKDLTLFDEKKVRKINAFDWQKEFSQVFELGGFDCVIGNPPYVKEYTSRDAFEGVRNHQCYQGKMDLWYLFGANGIAFLKEEGLIGFIAPNNWITNAGASKFRNFVLTYAKIIEYIDFGNYMVFNNASIQTMIYIMQKTHNNKKYTVTYSRLNNAKANSSEVLSFIKNENGTQCSSFVSEVVKDDFFDNYILFLNQEIDRVLHTIKQKSDTYLLNEEIITGIDVHQAFCNKRGAENLGNPNLKGKGIFNLTTEEYNALNLYDNEKSLMKPFYTGTELQRYYGNPHNTVWVIYTDAKFKNKAEIKPYPTIKKHLDQFAKIITSDNKPYGLHRARNEDFFKGEKIIALRKTSKPMFSYTNFDCYVSQSFNIIKTKRFNHKYLLVILNSRLIKFLLKYKGKMQGDNFQIDKAPLLEILFISEKEKNTS